MSENGDWTIKSGFSADQSLRYEGSETAPTWQPIETAPKDGARIIAFIPSVQVSSKFASKDRIAIVSWIDSPDIGNGHRLRDHAIALVEKHNGFWSGGTRTPTTGTPTHWMPLPSPPEVKP